MGSSVEGLPDFLFLGFTEQTGFDILALVLLVTVFTTALTGGLSVEVATLYFALIQTVISICTIINLREDAEMKHVFMVASGTHGVVLNSWRE